MWLQTGPTIAAPTTDGSPLDAAIYGIIILAGLIALSMRTSKVGRFVKANPAILVFMLYCLASTLWSDYSFVAFKRWTKAIGDIVIVLVVLTDPDQRGAIKRFLCRAGYVLIPVSILFIKYYPEWGRAYNPWTWIPMYSGVTTFKNLLGMITLVCALGTLWCFIRNLRDLRGLNRARHLAAEGTILGMSIWLFFTADSMTSLSCFLLAGGAMVIASQRWALRRRWILHLAAGTAIGIALVALFFDSSGDMVKQLGRNPTLTGRTAIWQVVIHLTEKAPVLGTGFESFWMGDRLLTVWALEKGIKEAHDGYLEVYANLGWVGIVLLGTLIVSGYRAVLATFARDHDIGVIKFGFFIAALIYSLTEAGFRMLSPVWLGFLLAIMSVPPRRSMTSEASVPVKTAQRRGHRFSMLVNTCREGL